MGCVLSPSSPSVNTVRHCATLVARGSMVFASLLLTKLQTSFGFQQLFYFCVFPPFFWSLDPIQDTTLQFSALISSSAVQAAVRCVWTGRAHSWRCRCWSHSVWVTAGAPWVFPDCGKSGFVKCPGFVVEAA